LRTVAMETLGDGEAEGLRRVAGEVAEHEHHLLCGATVSR
jgi:hypothetical protein